MTDEMHWGPDVPENPYPKYHDAQLAPWVRADVPFQETDDPESAVAWLDERLAAYEEECAARARMEHRISDMTEAERVVQEWMEDLRDPRTVVSFGRPNRPVPWQDEILQEVTEWLD